MAERGSKRVEEGGPQQAARVLRGGAYDNSPRHCRSAYRDDDDPHDDFDDDNGFRLAFAAAPASLDGTA